MRDRSSQFILAATTFAFMFIPPTLARQIALYAMLFTASLLVWTEAAPDVVFGLVAETRSAAAGGDALATITAPWSGRVVMLVPQEAISGAGLIQRDLVIGFGQFMALELNSQNEMQSVFSARSLGILPVGDGLAIVSARWKAGLPASLYPWGFATIGVGIFVLAGLFLRLSGALVLGSMFVLLAFLLLQINQEEALLPIPSILFPGLMLSAGGIGSVIGFKAMLHDRQRLGERMAAALLALPLMEFATDAALLPSSLAYALFPLALLAPITVPVGYATLALMFCFALDQVSAWGLFGAMLAIQFVFRALVARRGVSTVSPFVPQPNGRGQFNLEDLIDEAKER